MRIGVISDVHGSLHGLRAAIADLRRLGVDAWVSLGDLIGYGAHPNECVETVAELGAWGVAGNHELIALGGLPGAESSARAQQSHTRTASVLRSDVATYLSELPRRAVVGDIVLAHGSLDNPEEYVRSARQAADQLAQLSREHSDARLLLLGNTHRQQLYSEHAGTRRITNRSPMGIDRAQRHLANPGSVGQSRQWEWPPAVRALLVDSERSILGFRQIGYDYVGCRRELASQGLPYRSMHSPPPLGPAVRRRARRALNALR